MTDADRHAQLVAATRAVLIARDEHAAALLADRNRLAARVRELEAALQPFAELGGRLTITGTQRPDTSDLSSRGPDLRRAAAVLADQPSG